MTDELDPVEVRARQFLSECSPHHREREWYKMLAELVDEKTVNRRYSGCACTIEVRDGEEIIAGWCLVHAEVRRRAEDAEAALGAAEVLSTK